MTNKIVRPEDVLADNENFKIINGIKVRKGTIGAALLNAAILSSTTATSKEKEEAKKVIIELAPALVVLGIYDQVVWKNTEIQEIVAAAAKKLKK
jgi:hypothetical protein